MTIECFCGAVSSHHHEESSVSALQDESGFTAVFMNDGSMKWLCSSCAMTVRDAVKKLKSVFGPDMSRASITRFILEK